MSEELYFILNVFLWLIVLETPPVPPFPLLPAVPLSSQVFLSLSPAVGGPRRSVSPLVHLFSELAQGEAPPAGRSGATGVCVLPAP